MPTPTLKALLGTGGRAWLQTVNFVPGGLLLLAFAAGLRRALHGAAAAAGPLLLAAAAIGTVVAGLAPTDPALGYPPGSRRPARSPAPASSTKRPASPCSPGWVPPRSSWPAVWDGTAAPGPSTRACPAP